VTKIVKHDTYYPIQSETDRKRRLLPRDLWRFNRHRFRQSSAMAHRQWTHSAEANQQQALESRCVQSGASRTEASDHLSMEP
jgi:hypothetical protein